MKLHEFIHGTLEAIKNGIDEANRSSPDYKAHYPTEMEFDLALKDDGHICRQDEASASRFKFTMHLSHYPWQKGKQ